MKYRKIPEHNGENYLKAILESFVEYNAVARLDVAKLLHAGHKIAIKEPSKHASDTLVLEMLSKWMQALEDFSVLCMMFENPVPSDKRWEIYIRSTNQKILKFLYKIRRGQITQKEIMNIFGLKPAQDYFIAGKIRKEEIPYFRKLIKDETDSHKKTLRSIAKAYAGKKMRKKDKIEPSFLLEIYFKTKHGFKIIHQTQTSKKIWNADPNDIGILATYKKFPWGRKILTMTSFPKFTEANVDLLMKRIEQWSELIGRIADIQLKNVNDPYWIVSDLRLLKTQDMLKTKEKPGRNDDCLCESGMKFKKCCEQRLMQ